MKKQSFELNNMGIIAMSEFEMKEVDGGKVNWWHVAAIGLGCAAILMTGGAATPAVVGMADALLSGAFCCTMLSGSI